VVGAGFAGLNVVHELRDAKVDITLVDRNNFHTFQPLLYQVATAYLPAEQVGTNIRTLFQNYDNVEVEVADVEGVDWSTNTLQLEHERTVRFDYLVVATGATTNYFDIPGMAQNAWPLYTLADASVLRRHLLADLETSVLDHKRDPHESTIVVIGGGPTGVEMAGALTSMAGDLLHQDAQDLHVVLVEALPRLLNNFSEKSGRRALADLRRRGVDVRLGAMVASADSEGITFKDGTRIDAKTIVWAAGVKANVLGERLGLETGRGGAIVVNPDLRTPSHPHVFAAGDGAFIKDNPVPQLAPAAIQGGKHVGKQIQRLVKGKTTDRFTYRNKGIMAVIGRGNAVAELPGKLKFGGLLAWLLWLVVHVMYLVGFRNKLKVLIDWGWSYVSARGSNAVYVRDMAISGDRDVKVDAF
jgi:NADH dehydrogenase